MAKFASEVTIVHRRDELRACRCLTDKAMSEPKIKFLYSTAVDEIIGEKRVQQVRLRNLKTETTSVIDSDGLLLAIGWNPNTSIFKGYLDMNELGNLETFGVKSRKPGIYVAGDLMDRDYRQVVTSCGSGCSAALEAIHWLESQPIR